MAEFVPVLPAKLISVLDTSAPCQWHFVHATQVKRYPGLLTWLQNLQNSFIIIDCFAYELQGQEPKIEDTYWVLERLDPTGDPNGNRVIPVIPDILKDATRTLRLLKEHAKSMGEYGRIMIVPQIDGDLLDWMVVAESMIYAAQAAGPAHGIMVGLPRYMNEWGPDWTLPRRMAAVWLQWYHPELPVHLLGCSHGLGEAAAVAEVGNVVSVDSTSPFTYALEYGFDQGEGYGDKVEMQSTWWDLSVDQLSGTQLQAAKYNIAAWKWGMNRA